MRVNAIHIFFQTKTSIQYNQKMFEENSRGGFDILARPKQKEAAGFNISLK